MSLTSVIIPCRDGSRYLREAIEGIRGQDVPVEIILVDDGSTDGSGELAAGLGCRVIRKEKSEGQIKAKNDALAIATGDYVMFHDCDDVMTSGSLAKLVTELENDVSVSAVEAKVRNFVSPDVPAAEVAGLDCSAEPFWGLFTGAILMRASVWKSIGKFDVEGRTGEIIEWQGKMQQHGLVIKKLDFVSCNRRIHRNNFGRTNRKEEFSDYAKILRARLAARMRGHNM